MDRDRFGYAFIITAVAISMTLLAAYANAGETPRKKLPPRFKSNTISLGAYPGLSSLDAIEESVGERLNHVLVFGGVTDVKYYRVQRYLNKGYEVILCITFPDDHGNLREIKEGKYDIYLKALADKIVKDKRTIWLRPLHEFNGNWDNWDVLYPGNSKEDFVPAWRHVVTIFREKKAAVKFQLNYNRVNGVNSSIHRIDPMPFSELYPGDEWVDMVVISCYNRFGSDIYHKTWTSFEDQFTDPYNKVTALTEKPIGVAEIGTIGRGGDKPQWIIDAFTSFRTKFGRVRMITWFLYNRELNGRILDWALNSRADVNAFKIGMSILSDR